MFNSFMKVSFFFIVLLFGNISLASEAVRILIIHSYSQDYPWTKGQHKGFTHSLKESSAVIKSEYLDTKRIAYSPFYAENYVNFIAHKYKSFNPHAVYVTDDNALKFGLKYTKNLFPGTPLFFSGVNDYSQLKELNPNLETGVFEKKEIHPNLDLLSDLISVKRGSKIKVVIVGDDSKTDSLIKMMIENDLMEHVHTALHEDFG